RPIEPRRRYIFEIGLARGLEMLLLEIEHPLLHALLVHSVLYRNFRVASWVLPPRSGRGPMLGCRGEDEHEILAGVGPQVDRRPPSRLEQQPGLVGRIFVAVLGMNGLALQHPDRPARHGEQEIVRSLE